MFKGAWKNVAIREYIVNNMKVFVLLEPNTLPETWLARH